MFARRNNGFNPFVSKVFENGVGVVGLVGTERAWLQLPQKRQCLWAVTGLTAGELESGKSPQTFDQSMDFCTQSAA